MKSRAAETNASSGGQPPEDGLEASLGNTAGKRCIDSFGVVLDHCQQDNGRAVGCVTALFPIADRVQLEAEARGEVGLREAEVFPDRPHIHAWRRRNSVRLDSERKQEVKAILLDGAGVEQDGTFSPSASRSSTR